MTELRWQNVAVDSIWRARRRGAERLIRIYRVDPPVGKQDRRLVWVMIRTVVKRTGTLGESYQPKPGSRLSFTTVDRLGRDFELELEPELPLRHRGERSA